MGKHEAILMFTWKTPGWLGYKDTHTAISQGQDTFYAMHNNIQENMENTWLGYKDTHTAISQGQDTLYSHYDSH